MLDDVSRAPRVLVAFLTLLVVALAAPVTPASAARFVIGPADIGGGNGGSTSGGSVQFNAPGPGEAAVRAGTIRTWSAQVSDGSLRLVVLRQVAGQWTPVAFGAVHPIPAGPVCAGVRTFVEPVGIEVLAGDVIGYERTSGYACMAFKGGGSHFWGGNPPVLGQAYPYIGSSPNALLMNATATDLGGSLALTAVPSATAGAAFDVTVRAIDVQGNTDTGFTRTVQFGSSDSQAALPAAYTFTSGDHGQHTFSGVVLRTTGNGTITVSDSVEPLLARSATVAVAPGADRTMEVLGAPGTVTAGVAFNVRVRIHDQFGNTADDASPAVAFTTDDPHATLPSGNVTNGDRTFSVTLGRAGATTLQVGVPSLSQNQDVSLTVDPGPVDTLQLDGAPPVLYTGAANTFDVVARDAFGNLTDDVTGTPTLSTSDPAGSVSSLGPWAAGRMALAADVRTGGTQTVTVSDGTHSVTSDAMEVRGGVFDRLELSGVPAVVLAGAPFTLTVTARDPWGNRDWMYGGSVAFGTTAASASLPDPSTLVDGQRTFTLALGTPGRHTVTVTDTSSPSQRVAATVDVLYFPPPKPKPQPAAPIAEADSQAAADTGTTRPGRAACPRVPSLRGYTYAAAKRVLKRDGCARVNVRRIGPLKHGRRATVVRSQTPKPGTQPRVGDTVTLRLGARRR